MELISVWTINLYLSRYLNGVITIGFSALGKVYIDRGFISHFNYKNL